MAWNFLKMGMVFWWEQQGYPRGFFGNQSRSDFPRREVTLEKTQRRQGQSVKVSLKILQKG